METQTMIDTINAYADASQAVSRQAFLQLIARTNRTAEGQALQRLRHAAAEALEIIEEWPIVEKRERGSVVYKSPAGERILYSIKRIDDLSYEYFTLLAGDQ